MTILILIICTLFSFLITPLVIKFYKINNWLDDPEKNKHIKTTHQYPVPRGGGIVIFLTLLFASIFFLHIDKYLIAILLSSALLCLVGFLDDLKNLHPIPRLVAGLVAGLIVIGSGIGIAYISNPFSSQAIHLNQPQISFFILGKQRSIWILSDLLALIFILWNINIINWSKGVDGQLPGFVAVSAFFIGILSMRFIDDPTAFNTAHLAFIVSGAFLGLLVWNWYPQKIMPGYGGGALAGFLLSVLAILSGAKVATTLMVLGIPTADGIFTIARRILAGKSPFWGDRGHLHHKLMDIVGWSKSQIALFYMITSLVMGVVSLFLHTIGKIIFILIAMLFVFVVQAWSKNKTRH